MCIRDSMHVVHLEEDSSCCSELVFVKLHTPDVSVRSDIRQLCDLYGARVVDTQESEIIIELSEVCLLYTSTNRAALLCRTQCRVARLCSRIMVSDAANTRIHERTQCVSCLLYTSRCV